MKKKRWVGSKGAKNNGEKACKIIRKSHTCADFWILDSKTAHDQHDNSFHLPLGPSSHQS